MKKKIRKIVEKPPASGFPIGSIGAPGGESDGVWHGTGDPTGNKSTEEVLAHVSEQHELLLSAAAEGIIGLDSRGCHTFVNPVAARMLGYNAEELLGKPSHSTWHHSKPDGSLYPREACPIYAACQDGKAHRSSTEVFWRKDGASFPVDYASTPIYKQGRLVGAAITFSNITGRKQAEEVMRERETHLEAILEAAADGILAVDNNGKVLRANQRFAEIWRIPESLMKRGDDRALLDFVQAQLSDPNSFLKTVQSLYTSDAGVMDTLSFKDGRFFERYSFPMIMDGIRIGRVWSFRDVTMRKSMESKLGEARLHAETVAAAKSEFLAEMSHELRSPLNGILGFSELLSCSPLDDEQKEYARTITDSGNHLLAVVNDILDFSSLEKGALTIHSAPLAIAGLVESSALAIRKAAAEKGIAFRCEVASGVPEQIAGDERRIRQILINLLGNAVKFTASGSVVLRIAAASAGGRPALDFSVEDTGPGISRESLGHLFKPFSQADPTTNRQFGGTGLGLAISKHLAEAMDGSLSVVSTPGQGSTFTFLLPLSSPVSSAPPTPVSEDPVPSTPGHHLVLVVEDDRASSRLAGKMLQNLGYRTEFAAHGAEAVEAFAPGKFFAVFMDMAMPVMDGLEATKKIRELESGPRVPIIALTANVMLGDRERCLAAGMDDFLSKPFKQEDLAAKLARFVQPSA